MFLIGSFRRLTYPLDVQRSCYTNFASPMVIIRFIPPDSHALIFPHPIIALWNDERAAHSRLGAAASAFLPAAE